MPALLIHFLWIERNPLCADLLHQELYLATLAEEYLCFAPSKNKYPEIPFHKGEENLHQTDFQRDTYQGFQNLRHSRWQDLQSDPISQAL